MRTFSLAVKPIALALAGAVALYGCLGGGGGGGSTDTPASSGTDVSGVLANSLVDKAPIRLICTKDGTVLGTGTTSLGAYSVRIDPTKCQGQVLVELDTTGANAMASYAMAGPDNVFGTGDDEVYKPAERMPLKAMVDMTNAKVGDTVPANVSPITTAITNGALEAAGITTTNDLQTELAAKKPTDTAITTQVATATTNVANALGLTQTSADYSKIDPRTNTEMADKGGALAAAVFSASKAAGQSAQQVVTGIATNLNGGANVNGDITKLSGNTAVTAAITAAKPLIDAEANARKDMVDALQLMGVTTIPTTKAALDTLLTAKKADAAAVVTGTTTKVADVAAVFEARQKESVVIAAAQKYVQEQVAAGATAAVEMSKVVGAAVALVNNAGSFVSSTANADAAKQVAAQQDIIKNVMAVVTADVAAMNTVPTTISTGSTAQAAIDVSRIVTAARQIVTDAVAQNVVGANTMASVFATPAAVGGQAAQFDTETVIGVDTAAIATSVGATTTLQEFQVPPVAGSVGNINLDAAKLTDPGVITFATATKSAVTEADVIESDEITVANVNTQIPVKASGQGVTLVITNVSGVRTVLHASATGPYETPVGYVMKGDKVKLQIKSPPTAQSATRVSVTATLTLRDTKAAINRTASMTVQGPAGVVPGTPSGINVEVSDGSATVTFTAPSAGSAQITEYTVTATPVGGGDSITVTGTGTSITVNGLTNGTAYTFTVSAKNGVGSGTASTQSQSFTPATAPSAPTVGTATGGNGQATVSFTAPTSNGGAAITGYTVTSTPGNLTATGTASPITITGLTNGTAYTFTVKATNARGITSAPSAFSNSVTPVGAAGAPTGVTVVSAGNAHVVIGFTAPANTGGATISGYTVTATPAGGGTPVLATGSASPISVNNLTNGTAYTITVTATNSAGTGATSASVSATPATVPGAPTVGSVTGSDGQAVVSFTAPSSNGGSGITGYIVTSSPGGVTGTGTASPITVTGLTNGTAYTFTVVATNAKGSSAASSASASVTPAAAPGAPSGVSAVAGNASATVSFTAPASTGGATILDYTVTASPGGQTATGTSSPITISGLTNGTSYTFTVRARTTAGTGAASTASSAVTPATVPGAPTGVSAAAGNGQATVSFTVPSSNGGSSITGYTVTSSPGGLTGTGTASPITVSGLTNGTAYTFTVVAANAKGSSAASSASTSVTPVTLPGAPTGVSAVAGNASAAVSFTAPTSTGGATITGYTVTSSPGNLTATGTASPITISGLTNGTAYTFTVRATTSAGNSAASSASTAVTPATVPGAPTGVSAVAGDASAVVSFTAPSSNGGSAITGYTVTSSPGGLTASGSASPLTVSGLTNGTAYTFTVVAANGKGSSAASSASSSVTPAVPQTTPALPSAAIIYSDPKQAFNTVVTFGPYSLSGIGTGAVVSVSTPSDTNASSAVLASINGGAFGTSGTANNGDTITVRVTTGSGQWQAYVANVTVGSVAKSFAACTGILSTTDPDIFTPAGAGTNSIKCLGTPSYP